jgi:hypothetical protein
MMPGPINPTLLRAIASKSVIACVVSGPVPSTASGFFEPAA